MIGFLILVLTALTSLLVELSLLKYYLNRFEYLKICNLYKYYSSVYSKWFI